jgi:hypothetical protein
MIIKKRAYSFDFYDFVCVITEIVDSVFFIIYRLSKGKWHVPGIILLLKKQKGLQYQSYRRAKVLT